MQSSPFRTDLLAGKVAIVTGGGTGINYGIASAFAEHGCDVVLTGRRLNVVEESAQRLVDSYGVRALGMAGDVRDYEQCVQVVNETRRLFGRLDILVNGAAGNFLVPAEDLSSNGFSTVVSIDLLGTFNMCRASFDALKENDGDTVILNITATLGYTATHFQIHSSAAKMGVESLTRSLALEWGPFGIRCLAIAPGPVGNTEGMSRLAPPGVDELISETIPIGRQGTVYEIGLLATYLSCSASTWVTGASYIIDGGAWLYRPSMITRDFIQQINHRIK